ncbi:hypothetical protein HYR54_05395 [Candidatus Acetothermia bacterium]|nr:hypothetical protein [Candidatus Acetothermia bacterium]
MSFRLPDVLTKLRCGTPRKLYALAWQVADDQGVFTLVPEHFPCLSERTRRRWAARLVNWNLWDIVDAGGGRGKHPVYRVRGKADYLKKQQHELASQNERNEAHKKPGHEAKDKKIKPPLQDKPLSAEKNSAWKRDKNQRRIFFFEGWEKLERGQYGWAKCAQAFRLPLEELGLPKPIATTFTGLILSRLEGTSCAKCKELYEQLGAYLWKCKDRLASLIQKGVRKLCAWISWALSRLLKGLELEAPKSKRQKLWEINQRLRGPHGQRCKCIDCERERVENRREEYPQQEPIPQAKQNAEPEAIKLAQEWEQTQREQERWLAELQAQSVEEQLVQIRESLEIWHLVFESLHNRRPSASEQRERLEQLCRELQIPRETIVPSTLLQLRG